MGISACSADAPADGQDLAAASAGTSVTVSASTAAEVSPSPTPSPSPSTSTRAPTPAAPPPAPPGPQQPVMDGKPGPTNTGVPAGVALTVVDGDQTFSTPAVVSGKDFRGFVKVTGDGVTFVNCVFRGRASSSNNALLDTERGTNTVVQDSEFVPQSPSATIDDIWANNVSIFRANIHGGVDGVKTGSNVLVQDSYIHDMTWFASDPNQGGGETHNDGVQGFDGDSTVTLRHNTIDLSKTKNANAAFQNSASNSRVEGNWLDGGGCVLNFAHHDNRQLTGIYVTNNRFGRHSSFQCPILLSTLTTLNANSGNVWDDTGTPIPAPQRHD